MYGEEVYGEEVYGEEVYGEEVYGKPRPGVGETEPRARQLGRERKLS